MTAIAFEFSQFLSKKEPILHQNKTSRDLKTSRINMLTATHHKKTCIIAHVPQTFEASTGHRCSETPNNSPVAQSQDYEYYLITY